MQFRLFTAAFIAAALLAQAASAHSIEVGAISLTDLWARATPPGAPTAAAYLTITNNGAGADRLIAVSTPAASKAEIHHMAVTDGVMTMTQVDAIDIPAGATVTLAPGDFHLMFIAPTEPLEAGAEMPITLTFEKAGSVETFLHVIPIGAMGLDGSTGEEHEGH